MFTFRSRIKADDVHDKIDVRVEDDDGKGRGRNGCLSVAREISAGWFGNGGGIACFLRL